MVVPVNTVFLFMKLKLNLQTDENGKKWIIGLTFAQCAYCLCVQQTTLIRNKDGLVTHYEIVDEREHLNDCKQSRENYEKNKP